MVCTGRKKGMRSALLACVVVLLSGGLALAGQPAKKEVPRPSKVQVIGKVKPTSLSAAAGPLGGTFLPVTSGFALYVSEAVGGLKVSIEATGGSTENAHLIGAKQSDVGLVHGSTMFNAHRGRDEYKGKAYPDLRALFRVYGNVAHIVTLKRTGIKTVYDLKGKRVALGTPGSGSAISGEKFLRQVGLWDQIKSTTMPALEMSEALKDGRLDAYNWHTGLPAAAIVDTAATHWQELVFLNLHEPAEKSGFYKAYPYYAPRTIPAGTYRGQDSPVQTWDTGTYFITHSGLDPDVVYMMLKAYFSEEGLRYAVSVHASAKETSVQSAIVGVTIPLHPGAIRFWEEKGLKIPAELRP